jgi:hypothetical protein
MDDSPYILHHPYNEDCTTQGSQRNSFNMPFTYIHTQLPQIIFHYKMQSKNEGSLIIDSKCEPP